MDIFKKFKRNEDTTVNGAKMFLDKDNDVYILVARMHQSNPVFKKAGQAKSERHQAELERYKDDENKRNELLERLGQETVADVLITGWNGLEMNGEPFEFTPENAHRIRNELPELFEQIMQFALDSRNYVGTFDEDASLKNSQTASLTA